MTVAEQPREVAAKGARPPGEASQRNHLRRAKVGDSNDTLNSSLQPLTLYRDRLNLNHEFG